MIGLLVGSRNCGQLGLDGARGVCFKGYILSSASCFFVLPWCQEMTDPSLCYTDLSLWYSKFLQTGNNSHYTQKYWDCQTRIIPFPQNYFISLNCYGKSCTQLRTDPLNNKGSHHIHCTHELLLPSTSLKTFVTINFFLVWNIKYTSPKLWVLHYAQFVAFQIRFSSWVIFKTLSIEFYAFDY